MLRIKDSYIFTSLCLAKILWWKMIGYKEQKIMTKNTSREQTQTREKFEKENKQ